MSKLTKLTLFVCLPLWPISLFFVNTPANFVRYLIPALVIGLCLFLYAKKANYWYLPLLVIPLFSPKLILLPLSVSLISLIFQRKASNLIALFLSLVVILPVWGNFYDESVLKPNYDELQAMIGNQYLYPTPFLARMFHNKLNNITYHIKFNFLALTDPNNYFFGFHPREIPLKNQNLTKFPFLSIVFMLYGIYTLKHFALKKAVILLFLGVTISLSLVYNFDLVDFSLYPTLAVLLAFGIMKFNSDFPKRGLLISLLMLILALPEYLQLFVIYLR